MPIGLTFAGVAVLNKRAHAMSDATSFESSICGNIPIWIKRISPDPSAALYAIAAALFAGAVLAYLFIPANLAIQPRAATVTKTSLD